MKCPFDLTNKKQVISFDEIDPYNHNRVEGMIDTNKHVWYFELKYLDRHNHTVKLDLN